MKLDDLNQPEEWKIFFKKFAENPKGFLLLAGKNGTGKTFSAESIREHFFSTPSNIHWQDRCKFITQTDLNLLWIKDVQEWGDTTYRLGELTKYPLLILDDLGTRTPTEPFMDFLYTLIEKRERLKHQLGTIITTNLNAEKMREKFGDAFVSRIASGHVFRFEGNDRRFKDF
jgi:DNA replication protein DnaC